MPRKTAVQMTGTQWWPIEPRANGGGYVTVLRELGQNCTLLVAGGEAVWCGTRAEARRLVILAGQQWPEGAEW
jgi:hypothetical protein